MNKSSFFIVGQHAVMEALRNPRRKVLMVSRDINMRVISDSIGIPSQDYVISQVVENPDMLYGGFEVVTVDDQLIEQHYAGEEISVSSELAYSCFKNKY